MKTVFDFMVMPKEQKPQSFILNTELQNHLFTNRIGVVVSTPVKNNTGIKKGDEVVVHHNVFRTFRDIKGVEKKSRSFYENNLYFVAEDQIYAYKRESEWEALNGFNFVKPIENTDKFSIDKEEPLKGIIKYIDPSLMDENIYINSLVGFKPNSEYEFIIDGHRLYRVPTNAITIKYEYKGNEKAYNPSWAQSG